MSKKVLTTRLLIAFAFLAIVFTSCSSLMSRRYAVGVDPSFYPASVGAEGNQVYGFTLDLFKAISKLEGVKLDIYDAGPQSLLSGLEQNTFRAVITGDTLVGREKKIFNVSEPFLLLGPVIVAPSYADISSLGQLSNKVVGVLYQSEAYFLIQKYPKVVIESYDNPALMMEALQYDLVDGALINVLSATSLVNNLYQKQLKVMSKPLTDEGLRLLILQDKNPELVEIFNSGLEKAKRRGIYDNLLKKWDLSV